MKTTLTAGTALAVVTAVLTAAASPCFGQAFTFVEGYYATGISDDGRVASGSGFVPGVGGGSARWTLAGGVEVFGVAGVEPGFRRINAATAISGSGLVFAGHDWNESGPPRQNLYRWSGPGTHQALGNFPAGETIQALAMSFDGNAIVGTVRARQGSVSLAFVWTPQGGVISMPGVGEGSTSEATAVTADGSKVAGWRERANGSAAAFTWTASGGRRDLQGLPGASSSYAFDMNSDGSLICGRSGAEATACIWRNEVVDALGTLPYFRNSTATSLSDDGSIITGYASTAIDPRAGRPDFVWTSLRGMESFGTFLGHHGVQIPTGYLVGDIEVSANGRTFYGLYNDPRGNSGTFFVNIPAPATLGVVGIVGLFRRSRAKVRVA